MYNNTVYSDPRYFRIWLSFAIATFGLTVHVHGHIHLISCYCLLNKSSKELFDYVMGIHRQKELYGITDWGIMYSIKGPVAFKRN